MLEKFIELYEKGELNEEIIQQMRHFAFEGSDDEVFIIAQIFAAIGLAGQAVELLEPLQEKYPAETELRNLLADLYLDLAEDGKAMELLMSETGESDVKTLLLQADFYISQGLFEAAEEKIKLALQLEPDNRLLILAYGEYYFHIGGFEEAIPFYLDVSDAGLDLEIDLHSRLGVCYSQVGAFEAALEQFDLSEKYFGKPNTDQQFKRGMIAYQLNDFSLAKKNFQEVLEMDSTYDTVYPLLAEIHLKEGGAARALEQANLGIAMNEYNPHLFRVKGMALEAQNNPEAARDAYYEALNLDPEDLEAALKSNRISLMLEDFEEVVANVAQFEESGLVDERFSWDLAVSHLELENFDEACANFEKALHSFSDNAAFLFDYSQFLLEEGRPLEAEKWLRRLLELEPGALEAQQLLESLT